MLLGRYLPEIVQRVAEVAIGGVIVFLAARLLLGWQRGLYHAHTHSHDDGPPHRHVHSHAHGDSHEYSHHTPPHTPFAAFGVGLVHGIGGSGGLTLLLLSTISDKAQATIALLLFAAGTALSMVLLSAAFGLAIGGEPIRRHFERQRDDFSVTIERAE